MKVRFVAYFFYPVNLAILGMFQTVPILFFFFSTLVLSELHMWTRASGRSTDNMYSGYKTLVLIEISVFVGKQ